MSDPVSPTPVPAPDPHAEEPLITVGTITAVVTALLAAVVSFGLPLNNNQQAAILALVGVLAPFVVALWGRTRVFSPATVSRMLRRQRMP